MGLNELRVGAIDDPGQALHLFHVFPSFGIGGVPLRMARVINHLGKRCRHTIVALDDSFDAATHLSADRGVNVLQTMLKKNATLGNLLRIQRTLHEKSPDILLTYNWGSIEWALANRLWPVCRHIHFEAGFGVEEASTQLLRRVLMRRFALARCEALVVPSLNLKSLVENEWRIPPYKIRYLPNGIDIMRFATAPRAPAARPGPVVIGTVAPLRPEKNLARLLEAVRGLTPGADWKLVIAGDGGERARLEAMARALPTPSLVSFLGQVAHPERLLGDFDFFAMSSDTEQMPNALLEAMAAGLPVAATDVGDIRHMVAPENLPYIVPRDVPGALTGALAALIGNAALRATLGALNRRRVEAVFSQAKMLTAYERLLLT